MKVVVLGSAAGGGVPQWNCACDNCQRARAGNGVKPRTQDSIAVSADGRGWFLLNVSPDVGRQIESMPRLQPLAGGDTRRAAGGADVPPAARLVRQSPILGAVLTNGDLDHCLGLLSLREWPRLSVYATSDVLSGLVAHNAMFHTLQRPSARVIFHELGLDKSIPLASAMGERSGLLATAFHVAGKLPVHLAGRASSSGETNVGLIITDERSGDRLLYVPGAGSLRGVKERAQGVSCLLLDGTFWSDEELAALSKDYPTAREMAHVPVGGAEGSLELLADLDIPQRIYTHINNTNPMLREDSPERRSVEARGWRIAEDGMELSW